MHPIATDRVVWSVCQLVCLLVWTWSKSATKTLENCQYFRVIKEKFLHCRRWTFYNAHL